MARVALIRDTTTVEWFQALLKRNVLNTGSWRTRTDLHYASTYWCEHTYNRRSRQRGLRRRAPIEFNLEFTRYTIHAAT